MGCPNTSRSVVAHMSASFDQLPADMAAKVVSFMPLTSLATALRISKQFSMMATHELTHSPKKEAQAKSCDECGMLCAVSQMAQYPDGLLTGLCKECDDVCAECAECCNEFLLSGLKWCERCEQYKCHPAFTSQDGGCQYGRWGCCSTCVLSDVSYSGTCRGCFDDMEEEHRQRLQRMRLEVHNEEGPQEAEEWWAATADFFGGDGGLYITNCGEVCIECADDAISHGFHEYGRSL